MLLKTTGIVALLVAILTAQPRSRPGYQQEPTDTLPSEGRIRVIQIWDDYEPDADVHGRWVDSKTYYGRRPWHRSLRYRNKIVLSTSGRNGPVARAGQIKSILSNWIGTGWVLVPFGDSSASAPKIFSIKSNRQVRVDAVDLYCIGDRFRLEAAEVDNKLIYELTTSNERADGCHLRTADPQQAWEDGSWSQGTLKLPPGHYNIKVFAESSPYGGGTMALRARYV